MNIINDNDYCYFDLFWRMVVAFLHFVINSSDNYSVKEQQSLLFIITLSKLIIVEWLRLALWSVWTFLSTEKPLSASAFEQGIFKSPDINYDICSIHLLSKMS